MTKYRVWEAIQRNDIPDHYIHLGDQEDSNRSIQGLLECKRIQVARKIALPWDIDFSTGVQQNGDRDRVMFDEDGRMGRQDF